MPKAVPLFFGLGHELGPGPMPLKQWISKANDICAFCLVGYLPLHDRPSGTTKVGIELGRLHYN